MNIKENELLSGPVWKSLIHFFIPCWLGLLFQQLYNTVDTLVVGNFAGTNAVAAVGNVNIVVQFVIGICAGIGNGAGVLISQHYGAGRMEQVRRDVRSSLTLAVLGGLIFSVLCAGMSGEVVRWIHTPEEIASDSALYMFVYFCALVPVLIYNFGNAILRGIGDSRTPLYILIASSVLNIILDLVFVICFHWAVFGVALATAIAQTFSAVLIILILVRRFPSFWKRSEQPAMYGGIFRIGLPTAMESVMYNFSNILIQAAINSFGTTMIAGWAIYTKVDGLCWMTMSAMGMAVTSFAGQNFGAGNFQRVFRVARDSILIMFPVITAIIALFYLFAGSIFGIFSDDAAVIEAGVMILRFLSPAYLLFIPTELLGGVLRGCGDVVIPTIASVIGICLVRVLWLVFILPSHHTMYMVMASYSITWGITCVFYIWYFLRSGWMKRRTSIT